MAERDLRRVRRARETVGEGVADSLGEPSEQAASNEAQEIHQCRFDRVARLAPDLSHNMGSVDAGDLLRQRVNGAAAETGSTVAEQILAIQQVKDAITSNPNLTDQQKQDLLKPLNDAQTQLRQPDLSQDHD